VNIIRFSDLFPRLDCKSIQEYPRALWSLRQYTVTWNTDVPAIRSHLKAVALCEDPNRMRTFCSTKSSTRKNIERVGSEEWSGIFVHRLSSEDGC